MQKIGVVGAGRLGESHVQSIKQIAGYELVGIYDADKALARRVGAELGVPSFACLDELIGCCEVVDLATKAAQQFDVAGRALKRSKHVFIEGAVFASVDEAKKLMELAQEAHVKVQLGREERYNAAFMAARSFIDEPMFIEMNRYTMYRAASAGLSVVHELMFYDIDIILSIVNSPVKRLWARGMPVVSSTPDMANVRLEFDNGCVVNLNAGRVALERKHRARFVQRDAVVTVDFLNRQAEVLRYSQANGHRSPSSLILEDAQRKVRKELQVIRPEIPQVNAVKMELEAFYRCVDADTVPAVPISDGVSALALAREIMEQINFKI